MAHVQIRTAESEGPGVFSVLVDGVDLSHQTFSEGFRVTFPTTPEEPARVHMIVAADVLDIDLPAAVLEAIRLSDDEVADRKAGA